MDPARILLVEDEAIISLEIENNLQNLGYQVISTVDSGDRAIDTALRERPDLILMDIHIKGGVDGIETATIIKEQNNIPIIFLTAFSDEDKLERAKSALPFAYLLKPVQERDLKVTVSMALYASKIESERKQALAELEMMKDQLEKKVEERTEELRFAMEEAKTANQAKTDFLNKLSHEIRTPLHHMINFANFGYQKLGKTEEDTIKGYFKTISQSGHELLTMVDDLLDHAKLEVGKTSFSFEEADLRAVAARALMECQSTAESKEITLDLEEPDCGMIVVCDSKKIKQVYLNILSNALKFSSRGGTIKITFEESVIEGRNGSSEKAIKTSIRDNGSGIPDKELKLIFQTFYQSGQSGQHAAGTGLGLAICQEIISAHNGRIWAENNPEGGANFSFVLPVSQ